MDREKLKKYLVGGDLKEIAEKHGVSQSYISLIIKGERTNDTILKDIIDKAEANKSLKEQNIERTNNL